MERGSKTKRKRGIASLSLAMTDLNSGPSRLEAGLETAVDFLGARTRFPVFWKNKNRAGCPVISSTLNCER